MPRIFKRRDNLYIEGYERGYNRGVNDLADLLKERMYEYVRSNLEFPDFVDNLVTTMKTTKKIK